MPAFLCGDHVYWYATPGPHLADVVRSAWGAYWQPNVGVITDWPVSLEPPAPREEVSEEALSEMASAARAILIGAWDSEAMLIWEPESEAPKS